MSTSPARCAGRSRAGFTLIELLVVIAIIAILAAILFPVFAKAREKARQTSCVSNQKQIALAINMYVQDNDETFPSDPGSSSWGGKLSTYVSDGIFDCPTKTGKGTMSMPEYGFNANLFGKAMGDVANPSNGIILIDQNMGSTKANYAITAFDTQIDARHNSGAVVACVDGHVTWENFKGISGLSAMSALIQRGYDLWPSCGSVATQGDINPITIATGSKWDREALATVPVTAYGATNGLYPGARVEMDFVTNSSANYNGFGVCMFDPGATLTASQANTVVPSSLTGDLLTPNSVFFGYVCGSNLWGGTGNLTAGLYANVAAAGGPSASITVPATTTVSGITNFQSGHLSLVITVDNSTVPPTCTEYGTVYFGGTWVGTAKCTGVSVTPDTVNTNVGIYHVDGGATAASTAIKNIKITKI